jgi:hypothetical protein
MSKNHTQIKYDFIENMLCIPTHSIDLLERLKLYTDEKYIEQHFLLDKTNTIKIKKKSVQDLLNRRFL